jgi:hypothetical protein
MREEPAANGARPRIVVPIANKNVVTGAVSIPTFGPAQQQPGRVTVAVQGTSQKPTAVAPARKSSNRLRAIIVSVILIVAFAGMLLATRNYIRNRWAQSQPPQVTSMVGREAVTTTDVNLRAGPSSANDRVGLAETGSRVKVLSISSTSASWYEVQVLEHGRPKTDPSSLDRGWLNKQYLKFE